MINIALTLRAGGKRCALVPTMGALHEGHLSLLKIAQGCADVTVMSVFVNPIQFGPKEDFAQYPRPFERDCALAQAAGCDIVFAPSAKEMYPDHFATTVSVGSITSRLCGASRPDHFAGVTTVVLKLFNIVKPHTAVFGAKDAQQVAVIKRMVDDLHCPVEIVTGPIIREEDGLAMSSRNVYLTTSERLAARSLYRGLKKVEFLYTKGEHNTEILRAAITSICNESSLIVPEYIEIVDRITLMPLGTVTTSALVAVACRMQESATRLIDNTILGENTL